MANAPKNSSQNQPEEQNYNIILREFGGVNTRDSRQSIADNEFPWLENVMPVGKGNMLPLYGPTLKATFALAPYYQSRGNISGVEYMYEFFIDGSCQQVNLLTYASTTVAAAGTFSGSASAITQWSNSTICIIDSTKGYFTWDGATLTSYKGKLQSVTINNAGSGFTSQPTASVLSASGGGASVQATFSWTGTIVATQLVSGGSGYVVGSVLTVYSHLFGSHPPNDATITVSAVDATGAITGYNVTYGGKFASNALETTGPLWSSSPFGSGATFNASYGVGTVTVLTQGTGYTSAPTLSFSASGTAYTLTPNLAISASGAAIASYQGRIWIATGRTVIFSAPGSFSDFNPLDLAGSFVMNDNTLTGNITQLFSANNYLYIFGANSINVISNVTVTQPVISTTGVVTSPSVTSFSNTNIVSNIGTDMANTIISYYRDILFVNDYGIFSLVGTTATKISTALDGLFPLLNFSQAPSAGLCVINEQLCAVFLVQYNDPSLGTTRPLFIIFHNNRWFFASQPSITPSVGSSIYFISTGFPDSDIANLYAFNTGGYLDAGHLYQLFASSSVSIPQTIKTKLWDLGNPLVVKQAFKVGAEFIASNSSSPVNITVDSGVTNSPDVTPSSFAYPAAGYYFLGEDVSSFGNYLGLTITSSSTGLQYIGFYLQTEIK